MQEGDLASFLMVQISLACWFVHSFYMQKHRGLALALHSFVFFYWQAFKAREENASRKASRLFNLLCSSVFSLENPPVRLFPIII